MKDKTILYKILFKIRFPGQRKEGYSIKLEQYLLVYHNIWQQQQRAQLVMAITESKMVLDNHTITIWFFIGDKMDLNAFTGDWTHSDQLQRFMPPQKYYLFQPMICFHEIIPENFKQIPHISNRRKSKLQLYQHKLK